MMATKGSMRLSRTSGPRPDLRRSANLLALFILFAVVTVTAQGPHVFETTISSGWTLRDASLSDKGWKALLVWQDIDDPQKAYRGEFSSKLLIFDENDQLTKELIFEKPKFLSRTRDDALILFEGEEEYTSLITVVDRSGHRLFDKQTDGRSPIPALLGKEIALGLRDGMGPADLIGPITVIDARTGQERSTIEPPVAGLTERLGDFLPIGENSLYLAAGGTSLALATYQPPARTIWRIPDVGGSVVAIEPLDEQYVGVYYHAAASNAGSPDDLGPQAGVIILRWRTGQISFRQESRDPQEGTWAFLHDDDVPISFMDGDLFFTDLGGKRGIRISRSPGSLMMWDNTKIRPYRITNGEGDITQGHCILMSKKGLVRVERIQCEEEKRPPA